METLQIHLSRPQRDRYDKTKYLQFAITGD